ncbi:hypothetical protein O0L34_g10994 [Tuta absoluta]|nr:hypothetical protein O0L34_g10994 [Tuta absoluta]
MNTIISFVPRIVQVSTRLLAPSSTVSPGAELSLPCEVDGFPTPDVYWTKDGARLESTDRMQVTDARLTISNVNTNDSGEYGCHAGNAYSSHYSTVQISVQGVYVPAKCTDNPFFANCQLIVRSKFCQHKYYSKFCCKSCVEAGQLDPAELSLQADEGWRQKK